MGFVKSILLILFGTSWRSSLLGIAAGVITAAVAYAQAKPEPGWYVVAFALAALGRVVKDAQVTGGTVDNGLAPPPPTP